MISTHIRLGLVALSFFLHTTNCNERSFIFKLEPFLFGGVANGSSFIGNHNDTRCVSAQECLSLCVDTCQFARYLNNCTCDLFTDAVRLSNTTKMTFEDENVFEYRKVIYCASIIQYAYL